MPAHKTSTSSLNLRLSDEEIEDIAALVLEELHFCPLIDPDDLLDSEELLTQLLEKILRGPSSHKRGSEEPA